MQRLQLRSNTRLAAGEDQIILMDSATLLAARTLDHDSSSSPADPSGGQDVPSQPSTLRDLLSHQALL